MKIVKETKWIEARDLKGNTIMVKTIFEQNKKGKIYSRRIAMKQGRLIAS